MIIELVGIRGAGKTSAVAEVVKALSEAGVEARPVHGMNVRGPDGSLRPRWEIHARRVATALSKPRFAMKCLSLARSRSSVGRMLDLCHRDAFAHRLRGNTDSVIILDEGPLHSVLGLVAVGIPRAESLIDVVHQPDLVIHLTTDSPTAFQRVRTAGDMLTYTDDEILEQHRRYQSAAPTVLSRLTCVCVAGGTPIGPLVREALHLR
jgi:hypothetical protein